MDSFGKMRKTKIIRTKKIIILSNNPGPMERGPTLNVASLSDKTQKMCKEIYLLFDGTFINHFSSDL